MNTGTAAQLEYTSSQAREVMEYVTVVGRIQTSLAETPSIAALSQFQAQLASMSNFTKALAEVMPMTDPRVVPDNDKILSLGPLISAWGADLDSFIDLAGGGAAVDPFKTIVIRLAEQTAELMLRIRASTMASDAMASGFLSDGVLTTAVLTRAREALPEGPAAVEAVFRSASPGGGARRSPQVEVKRYKSAKDFERDAPRMYAKGWHIEGQSASTKKWSSTTGFFTNKQIVTVTWLKDD